MGFGQSGARRSTLISAPLFLPAASTAGAPSQRSALLSQVAPNLPPRNHAVARVERGEQLQLPYLQPFDGVNKRVSRPSANIPLIRSNLKPLSFIDVPKSDYAVGLLGVYKLNRIELSRDVFIWAYQRSAQQY